jgi:phosphoribosylformylglycinamidine synthase
VALAESCLAGDRGVSLQPAGIVSGSGLTGHGAGILFGESQSRFVVSVAPEHEEELRSLMGGLEVPFDVMGSVGGDRIRIGGVIDVTVADACTAHDGALLIAHG